MPVAARACRATRCRRHRLRYVYFFRGTPLLAQTFLIYYGLGSFRPTRGHRPVDVLPRGLVLRVFAFTLNTAAYQAEILRGAIESVRKGQWEGRGLARPDTNGRPCARSSCRRP
jgi:polar amino acid transport system permease protein